MEIKEPMSALAWKVWIGVGLSLLLSTMLFFGLVAYSSFSGLQIVRQHRGPSESFVLLGLAVAQSGLLRSLAMLIGLAIACGGLLVSFLTAKEGTEFGGNATTRGASVGLTLKSFSPGVVAVLLGASIIIAALFATTNLSLPNSASQQTTVRYAPAEDALPDAAALPSPEVVRQRVLGVERNASAATTGEGAKK